MIRYSFPASFRKTAPGATPLVRKRSYGGRIGGDIHELDREGGAVMHLGPDSLNGAVEGVLHAVRTVCGVTEDDLREGRATVIVTAGRAIDVRHSCEGRKALTHRETDRRSERSFQREIESMCEYLMAAVGSGSPAASLTAAERARIEGRVAELCPHARVVKNFDELASAVGRCVAEGDRGFEPMFGQANVWWLMGNRM